MKIKTPEELDQYEVAFAAGKKAGVRESKVVTHRQKKRIEELETRLEALLRSRPSNPTCISFSHAQKDQNHEWGECPCVTLWHRNVDLAVHTLKR